MSKKIQIPTLIVTVDRSTPLMVQNLKEAYCKYLKKFPLSLLYCTYGTRKVIYQKLSYLISFFMLLSKQLVKEQATKCKWRKSTRGDINCSAEVRAV